MGFGLVLDVEDDVVEGPLDGDGGGKGAVGVVLGFPDGVKDVVLLGDDAQGVVGIGRFVVDDDFQGREGVDVRLKDLGRNAAAQPRSAPMVRRLFFTYIATNLYLALYFLRTGACAIQLY